MSIVKFKVDRKNCYNLLSNWRRLNLFTSITFSLNAIAKHHQGRFCQKHFTTSFTLRNSYGVWRLVLVMNLRSFFNMIHMTLLMALDKKVHYKKYVSRKWTILQHVPRAGAVKTLKSTRRKTHGKHRIPASDILIIEMKRSCLSWINAGVFWNQWKCYLRNCISFVLSFQSAQPSSMLKNTFCFFIGIEPIDGFVFSLTIHFKLLNSNEKNVSMIVR